MDKSELDKLKKEANKAINQRDLDASKCQKCWDKIDQEFGGILEDANEYHYWSSWDLTGYYTKETDPFYRSTVINKL